MIKTKSVQSPIERRNDGLRILVTRIRGHGLRSSRYHVWMANLAPSETLLRQFQSEKIGWGEFSKRYKKELREGGTIDNRNALIKNHGQKFTLRLLQKLGRMTNVTLLGRCGEDEPHCHRYILCRVLSAKI
jgi:uncharacterized protein YeaO (DUF488 family)